MAKPELEQRGYETKFPHETARSRRGWVYVSVAAGCFVLLGLGTCVWSFAGLFQLREEAQTLSRTFIEDITVAGLPEASDPIYHPDSGVSQDNLDTVNPLVTQNGNLVSMSGPSCTVFSGVSTIESENGTRAECVAHMEYEETSGQIGIIWRQQSDTWSLYYFNIRLDEKETEKPDSYLPTAEDILK